MNMFAASSIKVQKWLFPTRPLVKASELSKAISEDVPALDVPMTEYNWLSDHRPHCTKLVETDENPIATIATVNLLSRHYMKYNTGRTLTGEAYSKPWKKDSWLDIKNQFGHHNSPLAKLSQEEREKKIADWLFDWIIKHPDTIIGLQEVSTEQYECLIKQLPPDFELGGGTGKSCGLIGYSKHYFRLISAGDQMYEKTDNYIRYAVFEPIHSFADSDKRICFVNKH